jgi:hypothetical protein
VNQLRVEDTGGAEMGGDKVGNKDDEEKGIVYDIDEEAMKLAIELGNKQNEKVENDLGESKV